MLTEKEKSSIVHALTPLYLYHKATKEKVSVPTLRDRIAMAIEKDPDGTVAQDFGKGFNEFFDIAGIILVVAKSGLWDLLHEMSMMTGKSLPSEMVAMMIEETLKRTPGSSKAFPTPVNDIPA